MDRKVIPKVIKISPRKRQLVSLNAVEHLKTISGAKWLKV